MISKAAQSHYDFDHTQPQPNLSARQPVFLPKQPSDDLEETTDLHLQSICPLS
jgi:hypothetical protein